MGSEPTMRHYSCDSHVVEGREVFEGLEDRFGDKAPRIAKDVDGQRGDWLIVPGTRPIPVGRLGIAGHRLDDPETDELIARGYEGLNPGVLDSSKRLDEQAVDGIVGEVMYPSLSMFTFAVPDNEIRAAAFERHNDWVVDYCHPAPERLIGVGCLPIPDVDASVAELRRAASKGMKGFSIPSHAPVDQPYSDPVYDPLWAAFEEIGTPITMHIFTGTSFDCGLPDHWGPPGATIKGYTLAHTTVVNSTIDLICGGVVERFPSLRFVLAEFETGWVAHFLQRFDHATYRTPKFAVDYLTMAPSEYFRRNFRVTFEDDEAGVMTRHLIGVENLLWGNDYPHHDAIWPHSMAELDRIMVGVPDEERRQMCFDGVVDLYGIDVSKLPAEAAA
jgi:predicted TIM-barrel fold metal-dependent hydrolase